jgi:hypothetical protein
MVLAPLSTELALARMQDSGQRDGDVALSHRRCIERSGIAGQIAIKTKTYVELQSPLIESGGTTLRGTSSQARR